MRLQQTFARDIKILLRFIIDGKQRLALFNLVAYFMVDQNSDTVVNRVALSFSTSAQADRGFANRTGIDLAQPA